MSTSQTSLQSSFEADFAEAFGAGATEPQADVPAWKVELQGKVAAHRQRRVAPGEPRTSVPETGEGVRQSDRTARSVAAQVAARVAERYAQAPSYRELLAASAAAAAEAAEMAALAARQAIEAQQAHEAAEALRVSQAMADSIADEARALVCLGASGNAQMEAVPGPAEAAPAWSKSEKAPSAFRMDARVEHPQPLPERGMVPQRPFGGSEKRGRGTVDAMAEALVSPAMSLPAKLIQFPRELVASRKARPRLAEGPLLEHEETAQPTLRIFEVMGAGEVTGAGEMRDFGGNEAVSLSLEHETAIRFNTAASSGGQYSADDSASSFVQVIDDRGTAPADTESSVSERYTVNAGPDKREVGGVSGWQSIRLGEHPAAEELERAAKTEPLRSAQTHAAARPAAPLYVAPLADRLMAALVDGALVGGAFLLFVLIFAACTAHPPVNRVGLAGGALVLACLYVFYQWLFMNYSMATPGMRYARVALCTFEDENPTRKVRRDRVLAGLLAALPLGLGLLWALFDEDSLGWHDRMTRSYQRSYR